MESSAKPLSIGIVLPVYNEAGILAEALEGLGRIHGGCEVVVVDGGSSDGSAGSIPPIADPGFRIAD